MRLLTSIIFCLMVATGMASSLFAALPSSGARAFDASQQDDEKKLEEINKALELGEQRFSGRLTKQVIGGIFARVKTIGDVSERCVDLLGCEICGFAGIADALTCSNDICPIKSLDLSINRIANFADMPKLPELTSLNLSNNLIDTLEHMPVFPVLDALYLEFNAIKTLKNMPAQPMLTNLFLWGNQIKTLNNAPAFPKMEDLCVVNQTPPFNGARIPSRLRDVVRFALVGYLIGQ